MIKRWSQEMNSDSDECYWDCAAGKELDAVKNPADQ